MDSSAAMVGTETGAVDKDPAALTVKVSKAAAAVEGTIPEAGSAHEGEDGGVYSDANGHGQDQDVGPMEQEQYNGSNDASGSSSDRRSRTRAGTENGGSGRGKRSRHFANENFVIEVPEVAEGTWSCSKCTYANGPTETECAMCQTPSARPKRHQALSKRH